MISLWSNKIVLSYCLKYWKNTENKKLKVVKTKNGRMIFSSKCGVCSSQNQELLKSKKQKGLKETCNLLKKLPLNLWWISNKTIIEVGNTTKAVTFKKFSSPKL